MDSQAIKYRAVLEGLQFQNLDSLDDLSLDECVDLGVEGRKAIQDIIDANNELRKKIPSIEKSVWSQAASMGLSLTPDACRRKAMEAELRELSQGQGRA